VVLPPLPVALVVLDHLEAAEESAWLDELDLQGTPYTVVLPPEGFGDAGSSEQLSLARSVAGDAEAVAWLSVDEQALHLSLAFLSEDRAEVKVVDAPRDADGPSRLALATRTLLTEARQPPVAAPVPEPAPEPPPVTPDPLRWQLTAGVVLPTHSLAGGLRPAVDGELTWPVGPLRAGGGLGLQGNGHHLRGGPRALVRWGPALVGGSVDVVGLEWVTWVQPRLEAGLTVSRGATAELRVRWAPLRDQVLDGDLLYDSGRVEVGLHLGWARQIRGG